MATMSWIMYLIVSFFIILGAYPRPLPEGKGDRLACVIVVNNLPFLLPSLQGRAGERLFLNSELCSVGCKAMLCLI
jgi:hypothetical protein